MELDYLIRWKVGPLCDVTLIQVLTVTVVVRIVMVMLLLVRIIMMMMIRMCSQVRSKGWNNG